MLSLEKSLLPPQLSATSMVSSLMQPSHSRRVPSTLSAILRSLTQALNHKVELLLRANKTGLKLLSEPRDLKTYQSATESETSSESTEPPCNSTKA